MTSTTAKLPVLKILCCLHNYFSFDFVVCVFVTLPELVFPNSRSLSAEKGHFSCYHCHFWDMILTYEFGLNLVHVNCHTEYLDQRIFRLKITVETHRHTQRTNHTIWWTTEVVGKNMRTRNDHSALKWRCLTSHACAVRRSSNQLWVLLNSCRFRNRQNVATWHCSQ